MEEPLAAAISMDQRGFVPGRSMLSNVVDIDEAMQRVALEGCSGAAWFFDFQAAFPSVAHRFLLRTLTAAGLPEWLLRFVHRLYQHNCCRLVIGGAVHDGFEARAGIRQGCPLSPILFAVAIDILLRRMRRRMPEVESRAFADDVATVTPSLEGTAPALHSLFAEFGRLSGLHLNMPKTYLIPLAPGDPAAVRRRLADLQPGWGSVQIDTRARYLGFELGPGRGHLAYDKPFQKVLERSQWWGAAGGGLFLTITAYSVYITSVVSFLAQLDAMPEQRWSTIEAAALRHLVPGSSQWAIPSDFRSLRQLGFPKELVDMRERQLAIRLRVAHLEAASTGGLSVASRAANLRDIRRRSDQFATAGIWADWFNRSFLQQLDEAVEICRHRGVTARTVTASLLGNRTPRPLTRQQDQRLRRGFQRAAAAALAESTSGSVEWRVRHKTERWQVPVLPRRRALNCVHYLRTLGCRVPPRVWAVAWRAVWNGWATARRTRGWGGLAGCAFACTAHAPDSLEHYANCQVAHSVTAAELGCARLPTPESRLANFLGLDFGRTGDPASAVIVALRAAAIYKVHCLCRHSNLRRGAAAAEALRQAIREAVRGHGGASQIYDAVHRQE